VEAESELYRNSQILQKAMLNSLYVELLNMLKVCGKHMWVCGAVARLRQRMATARQCRALPNVLQVIQLQKKIPSSPINYCILTLHTIELAYNKNIYMSKDKKQPSAILARVFQWDELPVRDVTRSSAATGVSARAESERNIASNK